MTERTSRRQVAAGLSLVTTGALFTAAVVRGRLSGLLAPALASVLAAFDVLAILLGVGIAVVGLVPLVRARRLRRLEVVALVLGGLAAALASAVQAALWAAR
ncbi:MAG: hypothetical protein HY690_21150 [Chloroflexi bacterium]|nr:hypothetical protein [Chloroflexota bacterium]